MIYHYVFLFGLRQWRYFRTLWYNTLGIIYKKGNRGILGAHFANIYVVLDMDDYTAIEIGEFMNNYIPAFYVNVITHSCPTSDAC